MVFVQSVEACKELRNKKFSSSIVLITEKLAYLDQDMGRPSPWLLEFNTSMQQSSLPRNSTSPFNYGIPIPCEDRHVREFKRWMLQDVIPPKSANTSIDISRGSLSSASSQTSGDHGGNAGQVMVNRNTVSRGMNNSEASTVIASSRSRTPLTDHANNVASSTTSPNLSQDKVMVPSDSDGNCTSFKGKSSSNIMSCFDHFRSNLHHFFCSERCTNPIYHEYYGPKDSTIGIIVSYLVLFTGVQQIPVRLTENYTKWRYLNPAKQLWHHTATIEFTLTSFMILVMCNCVLGLVGQRTGLVVATSTIVIVFMKNTYCCR